MNLNKKLSENNISKEINNEGNIEVYFQSIEEMLLQKIEKADIVVGCVAYITNVNILKSLEEKHNGVALVINKTESISYKSVPEEIRRTAYTIAGKEYKFNKIYCQIFAFEDALKGVSFEDSANLIAPIRMVGN